MQVLSQMGMQVSEHLIPANASNPEGFFEDAQFKDIHANLIANLGSFGYLPLPDDWVSTESTGTAILELKKLLKSRLDSADKTIFGFKDPRISMLLPIWLRVFNRLSIVPRFVLSVRDPSHVVSSMVRQYDDAPEIAELAWLMRTLESLEHTAADCFIVHYERWFADSESVAQALSNYTGLNQNFKSDLSEILKNTIKSNLDHAQTSGYVIRNPYVNKLYFALKKCHGEKFDRKQLMTVVKECREVVDGFKGWRLLAYQANKQQAHAKDQLNQASVKLAEFKSLEARMRFLKNEKAKSDYLVNQVEILQQSLSQLISMESRF